MMGRRGAQQPLARPCARRLWTPPSPAACVVSSWQGPNDHGRPSTDAALGACALDLLRASVKVHVQVSATAWLGM
eukprot:3885566-Alexandrium_andersonii.AAC.1